MTTYGPDVPTVNLPLVFVYLYGHPFYEACMTIGLIAKSMLELKHVIFKSPQEEFNDSSLVMK